MIILVIFIIAFLFLAVLPWTSIGFANVLIRSIFRRKIELEPTLVCLLPKGVQVRGCGFLKHTTIAGLTFGTTILVDEDYLNILDHYDIAHEVAMTRIWKRLGTLGFIIIGAIFGRSIRGQPGAIHPFAEYARAYAEVVKPCQDPSVNRTTQES